MTHNHPEGLKGAEATAVAIFMARDGATLEKIREAIVRDYYPLDFTIDGIRESYNSTRRARRLCRRRSKRFWSPLRSRTPSAPRSPSAATATLWRPSRAASRRRTTAFRPICVSGRCASSTRISGRSTTSGSLYGGHAEVTRHTS